jgi:two-component system, OmpR family, sensor kinase
MSLANRITLLVIGLLALWGVLAGMAFYGSVRREQDEDINSRLETRLAWLAGTLSVDLVEEDMGLEAANEPAEAAEHWQIAMADGRVLWASEVYTDGPEMVRRTKVLTFGDPGRPLPASQAIVVKTATEMARGDEPANTIGDQERKTQPAKARHPEYRLPPGTGRLELVLTAGTSAVALKQDQDRLAGALWTVGPLALVVAGILLALLIRQQLRPLARMAEQACCIGPDNSAGQIGPVGGGVEIVQLRDAINAMVKRLGEGLERERQFASTAAHELRTPLAQLRIAAEVALRQERSGAEYKATLADVLTDVQRLQALVVGLLELARSQDAVSAMARPVPVAVILALFRDQHIPVQLPDASAVPDLTVAGDEALFSAVISNILENAIRYAPGQPPTLRITADADHVLFVVADRGPGVPESKREYIFQPLTRLDQARTIDGGTGGFGLGLAVARSVARRFGGDLFCRARSDGASGVEFVLRLRKHTGSSDVSL